MLEADMLEALTDMICTSTMCFGMMSEEVANDEVHHHAMSQTPSRPVARIIILDDEVDNVSSCAPFEQELEQELSEWNPTAFDSLPKVPSVIRLDSPIHPSTPIRDSDWLEQHQIAPGTPIKPLLEAIVIKDSNDNRNDDATVSTQSSYSVSVMSPSPPPAESPKQQQKRLVWRRSNSAPQQRSSSRSEDGVDSEDIAEEGNIRFHGPVMPVKRITDWVFGMPTNRQSKKQQQQQQQSDSNNNKQTSSFKLRRPSTSSSPPPFLPRLD